MKLLAIRNTVDVYSQDGYVRKVNYGEIVGTLAKNNYDGTLLLDTNELVDIDAVAITQQGDQLSPKTFEENQPVQGAVISNSTDKNYKLRKLIAISLVAGGAFAIYKGRRSIGITMVVFGLIMFKRNNK